MNVTGKNPPNAHHLSTNVGWQSWAQFVELSADMLKAQLQQQVQPYRGYAAYVGADYETVQWSQPNNATSWSPEPDDGSAAHEPEHAELRPPPDHETKLYHWLQAVDSDPFIAFWHYGWGKGSWNHASGSWHHTAAEAADCGLRYLGPAEWNPVAADISKRLEAGAGAYHALSEANAEIKRLRALLSRVEDAPAAEGPSATPTVQADIDRTIDHLVKGQTTPKQRKDLATATERAERDAAVGRALR